MPHSQFPAEPSFDPPQASPLPLHQEAWQIPCIAAPGYSYQRYETSQLLYDYLGFVHPLPLLLTLSSPLDSTAKKLIGVMSGLHRDDIEFFDSLVAPFSAQFLSALNTHKTPKNSSWDLANRNCLSVVTAKCLDHLYIYYDDDLGMEQEEANSEPKAKLYQFDFKKAVTVPWIITVPDPMNALFLCHLDPQLTDVTLPVNS
jgi:hypothetical protein